MADLGLWEVANRWCSEEEELMDSSGESSYIVWEHHNGHYLSKVIQGNVHEDVLEILPKCLKRKKGVI